MKKSKPAPTLKHTPLLKIFIASFLFSPFMLLLAYPTKIGTTNPTTSYLKSGQIILSEALTYTYFPPQTGDHILFYNAIDNGIWFGIITNIDQQDNITLYTVASRTDVAWTITADKIYRRVYYPQLQTNR